MRCFNKAVQRNTEGVTSLALGPNMTAHIKPPPLRGQRQSLSVVRFAQPQCSSPTAIQ